MYTERIQSAARQFTHSSVTASLPDQMMDPIGSAHKRKRVQWILYRRRFSFPILRSPSKKRKQIVRKPTAHGGFLTFSSALSMKTKNQAFAFDRSSSSTFSFADPVFSRSRDSVINRKAVPDIKGIVTNPKTEKSWLVHGSASEQVRT